jgi:GTP-binding protein EngB required for normal cell division
MDNSNSNTKLKFHSTFNESIINSIREIASKNNYKNALNELNDLEEKLINQKIYIVVLGLFKRGKSSLINALIGDNIAPVAITPLTSVITFFQFSDSPIAEIVFENNSTQSVTINKIIEFVSEELNPENIKKVKQVNVWLPSELLKNLVLVDTPGLGSLYEHNSDTTVSFIPKIDAALFVLSADLPMSKADGEFLKSISNRVPKLIYLLNKIDLLKTEELEQLRDFNIKNIAKQTDKNTSSIDLIPVSAKQYLESSTDESKHQSGIIHLKKQILELVDEEGNDLIKESATNRIQAIINQMMQLLNLQRSAYNTPIKDIEAQMDHLRQSLSVIQINQGDFLSVIKNRIKLIQEEVTSIVNSKAKDIKRHYQNQLLNSDSLEHILNTKGSKEFISDLNSDIKERYLQLHQTIEKEVKQKFTDIMIGFINQSQHFLNELSKQLENQLGTKIDMVIGKFDLAIYSPFYIRNVSEYHISESKSNPLLNILPKAISKKLFVKSVLRELEDVITSNSAGMLYDITYRMDESLRKMTYDLNIKTTELISELLAIMAKSKEEITGMKAGVKDAIDKVNNDLLTLEKLKSKL